MIFEKLKALICSAVRVGSGTGTGVVEDVSSFLSVVPRDNVGVLLLSPNENGDDVVTGAVLVAADVLVSEDFAPNERVGVDEGVVAVVVFAPNERVGVEVEVVSFVFPNDNVGVDVAVVPVVLAVVVAGFPNVNDGVGLLLAAAAVAPVVVLVGVVVAVVFVSAGFPNVNPEVGFAGDAGVEADVLFSAGFPNEKADVGAVVVACEEGVAPNPPKGEADEAVGAVGVAALLADVEVVVLVDPKENAGADIEGVVVLAGVAAGLGVPKVNGDEPGVAVAPAAGGVATGFEAGVEPKPPKGDVVDVVGAAAGCEAGVEPNPPKGEAADVVGATG
jgi:hypothetical protein